MTTNSLFNRNLNDFLVTSSMGGVDRTLTTSNTVNAANSAATIIAQVAGAASGDPSFKSSVAGVNTWAFGTDNSDAQKFKVSQGGAVGLNDTAKCTTAGQWNYPLQPSFRVYQSVPIPNVTGDNTFYDIPFNTTDFDIGGNVVAGVFTAPIDGKYIFTFVAALNGIDDATHTTVESFIAVTGIPFAAASRNRATASSYGVIYFTNSCIVHLVAGNTVHCTVEAEAGAKTVGVMVNSAFAGHLLS